MTSWNFDNPQFPKGQLLIEKRSGGLYWPLGFAHMTRRLRIILYTINCFWRDSARWSLFLARLSDKYGYSSLLTVLTDRYWRKYIFLMISYVMSWSVRSSRTAEYIPCNPVLRRWTSVAQNLERVCQWNTNVVLRYWLVGGRRRVVLPTGTIIVRAGVRVHENFAGMIVIHTLTFSPSTGFEYFSNTTSASAAAIVRARSTLPVVRGHPR